MKSNNIILQLFNALFFLSLTAIPACDSNVALIGTDQARVMAISYKLNTNNIYFGLERKSGYGNTTKPRFWVSKEDGFPNNSGFFIFADSECKTIPFAGRVFIENNERNVETGSDDDQ